MLRRFAEDLEINCSDMELRYQRHILFQRIAADRNFPIQPGPAIDLAKWASNNARMFVITARSGWSATQRVRQYLLETMSPPIEVYQVGRTPKKLQVELVCREFPAREVLYVEDSTAHLFDASTIIRENLHLVHAFREIDIEQTKKLYMRAFSVDMVGENKS